MRATFPYHLILLDLIALVSGIITYYKPYPYAIKALGNI